MDGVLLSETCLHKEIYDKLVHCNPFSAVTAEDVLISEVRGPLKPVVIDLADSETEDSKSAIDIKVKTEEGHER